MKSIFIVFGCLFLITRTFGQVTSNFNADVDGWTCTDNGGTPITINYNSTDGNPGGFVSASATSSQPYFLVSPAKFGGNIAYLSYGQLITFDLQLNHVGTIHGASTLGDVQIRIPSGQVLAINLPTFPALAPDWSSHSIRLDETAGWRLGHTGGPLATKADMLNYLSQIHTFRFSIKYTSSSSVGGAIDNVILNQRILIPSPQVISLSNFSGKPGDIISINGSGFETDITNSTVYFGGVQGIIQDATATQLDVIVPVGAQYGPIRVISKITGFGGISQKPFIPLFNEGGRIIRASFASKISLDLPSGYGGHSLTDMDGDGWPDVVVASQDNNTVYILRNLGTGGTLSASSFASPLSFATGLTSTNGAGVRTIDLDGDGKLDMIASGWTGGPGALATFRNTSTPGNLSFEPSERWNAITDESPVLDVVDIDGDGLQDVVSGEGSAPGATWITQNFSTPGDIVFMPSKIIIPTLACNGASFGDLTGDGKPELLMSNQNAGSQIVIYTNTSTPGLISFGLPITIPASLSGRVVVADLNEDNKNDIIWHSGFSADDVIIRLNTNSGGSLSPTDFSTPILLDSDLSSFGGDLCVADINGDGKVDIVVNDTSNIGVFENIYTGGPFSANSFISAYLYQGVTNANPIICSAADLNGDNKPELTLGSTNSSPNQVWVFQNRNAHAPEISINTVSPLSAPVSGVVTITGDYFSTVPTENTVKFGTVNAQVLTASKTALTVTVPAGASYGPVSVTRNNLSSLYHLPFATSFSGGVSFDNSSFGPSVDFTLNSADFDIEVGDFNADGKPDVVAEAGGFQSVLFSNAHSSGVINNTSLLPQFTISGNSQNPRLIDIDEDGMIDLVSTTAIIRNISSASNIQFAAPVIITTGANHGFADFNLDGKQDIAGAFTSNIAIRENRSAEPAVFIETVGLTRTLGEQINLPKPAVGGAVVAADFDNDGLADLATTNPNTDNISLLKNLGAYRVSATQFATQPDQVVGDNPGRIYTADFDMDGRIDIIINHGLGTDAASITILHNQSTLGNFIFNHLNLTNPGTVTSSTVADLDGDGKPEIITTSETGNRFSIFKNIHTSGALTAASFAAPFNTTVTAPRGITTGDLNLDGKPEIILTRAAGFLVVYENLVPTIAITITQQPASPYYACEGGTASFTTTASGTTNITYQWQKFDGSVFVDLANSTTFSGVTSPTLTINNVSSSESGEYQCVISGDFAAPVTTDAADLVFNSLPSPPDVVNGVSCGPGGATLTASGGSPGNYQWYTSSPLTPIAGEVNETYNTPLLTTNTDYYVSLRDTFCESIPVLVTAIISTPPPKPDVTSSIAMVGNALTICSTTVLTLTAPAGYSDYYWFDNMGYPFGFTDQITVTSSSTYRIQVLDANGCASEFSDDFVITVAPDPCTNTAPVINTSLLSTTIGQSVSIDLLSLVSDADNNLVLSSLNVEPPQSGAAASINGTNLLIDYNGLSFTGLDVIRISICDEFGECPEQTLEINVIGEIEIFNAVSPNGDDRNPYFRIENIEALEPDNSVTIYNRWGSKVFEVENYTEVNAFRGLNLNGNELPSGTYFYKIFFKSTGKTTNGFLVLKR